MLAEQSHVGDDMSVIKCLSLPLASGLWFWMPQGKKDLLNLMAQTEPLIERPEPVLSALNNQL